MTELWPFLTKVLPNVLISDQQLSKEGINFIKSLYKVKNY